MFTFDTSDGIILDTPGLFDAPAPGHQYYIPPGILVTFPDGTPVQQSMSGDGWRRIIVSEDSADAN